MTGSDSELFDKLKEIERASSALLDEHTLRRAHRALRVLAAMHAALEGVASEAELSAGICRVAVEVGGYEAAWVVRAEDDEPRSLGWVASVGVSREFIESAGMVWADTEQGRGPGAGAVRSGAPVRAEDGEPDRRSGRWPKEASPRGWRSGVGLPLLVRGRVWGPLVIWSSDAGAFDENETGLLMELAKGLSRAIGASQADARRLMAEAYLAEVLDGTDAIAWATRPDGRTLHVSEAAERVLGHEAMGHLRSGGSVRDFFLPGELGAIDAAVSGAANGVGPVELEHRIVRPGGEVRWWRTVFRIERAASGAVAVLRGISRDITERRRAEDALAQSELRWQRMVDTGWDLLALADREHHFRYANAAWARVLGHDPASLVGTEVVPIVHPDDAPTITAALRALAERPETGTTLQVRVRHRAGHHVPLEITLHNLLDDPAVGAIVASGRDVTERERAREALERLNADLERRVAERTRELSDLYDHAPCGYHTIALDGTYLRVNDTELGWLGYTREEMIGRRTMFDVLPPEQHAAGRDRLARYARGEAVSGVAVELQRKDGSRMPALVSAQPQRDTSGRVTHVRVTLSDDSERRHAYEQMREASAAMERASHAKDEFLAGMSHELRTPLNAVLGLSELLTEEVHGPLNARQQHSVRRIEESGRHLLSLINDILDLSKIEAGKVTLERTAVSISEVCRGSLRLVQEAAVRKRLRVGVSMSESSPALFLADERRLKQILVNLLSNAVKFTPEGGEIGLEAIVEAAPSAVRFVVRDSGVGIAPEDQARLFQPFVQIDSSLSREQAGTGLGLALVRQLAELHGGTVELVSRLGEGSRFTVTLPLLRAGTPALGLRLTPRAATTGIASARSRTLLLAEDDELNVETVIDFLRARGFEVEVARNGAEAVAKVRALLPDVVLMDVQMPVVDGLTAIRAIRADEAEAVRGVPIIALTALAMPHDRARCMAAGADAYLTKPVGLKALAASIDEVIAGHAGDGARAPSARDGAVVVPSTAPEDRDR